MQSAVVTKYKKVELLYIIAGVPGGSVVSRVTVEADAVSSSPARDSSLQFDRPKAREERKRRKLMQIGEFKKLESQRLVQKQEVR